MNAALYRIGAVVRADLQIRLRRTSTLVILLLLCAVAYVFVPDLATGRTLMQVDNRRALYDSATISIVTASLCSMFLGMIGYYVISNTIRRDIISRTGFVIASMPVSNLEYLAGKYAGNVAFLALVVLGYILNVMGMHLLRGEAPIQPLTYLATFAVMTAPAICIVAAFALLFECVRPLSGRIGDVLYFFIWIAMVAGVAASMDAPGHDWRRYADVFGMAFVKQQVNTGAAHQSLSIGSTTYDPVQPVWIFPGIDWRGASIAPRLVTSLLAVPLLLLAWAAFVRFDPARIKGGTTHSRLNPLGYLNKALKPVTRILAPLAGRGEGLGRVIVGEMALTFMLAPVAIIWLAAVTVAGVVLPAATISASLLPLTFLGLVTAITDIASRDQSAGTTALLFSMPVVRERYGAAKLGASIGIALLFVAVPLLRLAVLAPADALSLLLGTIFVACAAASLGLLTGGPKTFAALYLFFLYVVMNSRSEAGFDFAGFNGVATNGTRLAYLGIAVILALVAILPSRTGRVA